jgi:hypothetical protein
MPPKDLAAAMNSLKTLAAQAGRKASDFPVSIFGVGDDAALLRQYQELGVERAVLALPSEGREAVLPLLDRYAALIPKFA